MGNSCSEQCSKISSNSALVRVIEVEDDAEDGQVSEVLSDFGCNSQLIRQLPHLLSKKSENDLVFQDVVKVDAMEVRVPAAKQLAVMPQNQGNCGHADMVNYMDILPEDCLPSSARLASIPETPGREGIARSKSSNSVNSLPSPRRKKSLTVDLGAGLYDSYISTPRSGRKPLCLPSMCQPRSGPQNGLEIIFVNEDGEEKRVAITRQPLGARFARHSQGEMIKTSYVLRSSHADELGIKEGWFVKQVDGQDVTGTDFEDLQSILKRQMAHLPEKSHK